MSNRSLRRILYKDLSFHSYKLIFVQELNITKYEIRKNRCHVFTTMAAFSLATEEFGGVSET